ncbi:maltose phosphorylase [Cutibacterium acnes JCM 18918]|nr:maltose phosphorylase [Cutibacterium acnes JCM 18918]
MHGLMITGQRLMSRSKVPRPVFSRLSGGTFSRLLRHQRADQLGIPAKGVTGSGYEGHYFWDTEVYVIPMLTYTHPRIAENALRFRVNTSASSTSG